MEWSFHSNQPIYTQLIEQLTLAILSGEYPTGGKLPAVRELAAEAGVNPNTMQGAALYPPHERTVCNGGRNSDSRSKAESGTRARGGVPARDGAAGL